MTDESLLAYQRELEAKKARALEEAAALERKLTEVRLMQKLASEHGFVITPSEKPTGDRIKGGTIADLVDIYYSDPRSSFHKLRFATKRNYRSFLKRIAADWGHKKLAELKAADVEELYAQWMANGKIAMSHSLAVILRVLINFGAVTLEDPACQQVSGIMHNIQLPKPPAARAIEPPSKEQMEAFLRLAHENGWPSMALAQAIKMELPLRQKDIIGEWIPLSEDGISDILHRGSKWLRGITWDEIDENLILRHTTSWEQNKVEIDLSTRPLVMRELKRFGIKKSGAVIVDEGSNRRPYTSDTFRKRWRYLANAVGIPKEFKNMDLCDGSQNQSLDHGEGVTATK